MLYDFIFLFFLFALIYSYISSQEQFAATASAIGQIYSGSCRLSCRLSQHSGISGLSGLPHNTLGSSSPGTGHGQVAKGMAGHSRDCHCESCPCALIENFLRTCRPATNIYTELMQCISNCVTQLLNMIDDLYYYFMRVFECNASCQRQAQIRSSYMNSDENFSFERGDKEPVDKIKSAVKEKPLPPINQQPSQNVEGDAVPLKGLSEPLQGTSKDVPQKEPDVSKTAAKIPDSSEDSVIAKEKGYCSKCIEKGRTCLKECPKAGKSARK